MATFGVHFDGPITVDHKVTIRVLSKTYEHMQRAIDRSYLIQIHGEVWKHARLTENQYRETDFIAEYPREGGIILDAVRAHAGQLIDRVANAIRPVFEGAVQHGLEQHATLDAQLAQRKEYVRQVGQGIPSFEEVEAMPPQNWANAYSNRSIVKEIDQLVTQITPERLERSTVDLIFHGDTVHLPFQFTAPIARRFHSLASKRELAAPMVVRSRIRTLDRGNKYMKPSAKILNLDTQREVSLHLSKADDFDALHPFHNVQEVSLFVSPIVEALGYDLRGGDLMFLAVAG